MRMFNSLMGSVALAAHADTGSKAPNTTAVGVVGKQMEARAVSMGAMMAADDTLTKDLSEYNEAKTTIKVGPLWALLDLEQIEGLDLDQCPHPDSVEGKTNHPAGPAKYTIMVGTDAGKKPQVVDFYATLAATLPEGKKHRHVIEQVGLAKKMGADKAEPLYLNMSTSERDEVLKDANAQFNALKAVLRSAVKLHYIFQAVNELPHVEAVWRLDADKNVKKTQYPVMIVDKKDRDDFANVTIGSFLTLDPWKAKDAGGTKAALLATSGRDTEDDDEEVVTTIKNVEQWEDYASELEAAMEDAKFIGNLYSAINAKDSDDLLTTVFKLERMLGKITGKPELQKRWKTLNEGDEAAKVA